MMRLWSVLVFFALFPLQAGEIEQAKVTKWLTGLASDEMAGRAAGTDGARKAAKLIAGVFTEAGLKPLDGAKSFRQEFQLKQLVTKQSSLKLAGQAIAPEMYVVRGGGEAVRAERPEDLEIISVTADQNPMAVLRGLPESEQNRLVLLNPSHEGLFQRLRGFFERPQYAFEIEAEPALIVVVSELTEVKQVSLSLTRSVESHTMANVMGVLPGTTKADEFILVSAHYDHLGSVPGGDDTIANGANDNASGTTGVLALADYFGKRGGNARSLIFAAFTAEEIGLLGSTYASRQIKPEAYVGGLNLEMIGRVGKFGKGKGYLTGPQYSTMTEILRTSVAEGEEQPFNDDPFVGQNLFFRSDNAPYARLGIPVHSFSTSDIDSYYHSVKDEVAIIDFEHMTMAIKTLAKAMGPLVDGSATPSRVDQKDLPGR